jgi:quercetin dioxygenase-like cupin family protein
MRLMIRSVVIILSGLTALSQVARAGETQDLPHAFDAGWQGQKTCTVLFEDPAVRVARCVFPPGVGHEKHYHNPHYGYVLEGGTLRIVDASGERTVTTESGGSWSTDAVTVHEAVNIGATTTSYLVVEPVPH